MFRVTFAHTTVGNAFAGKDARYEQVEFSVNGERVALIDVDQWLNIASPEGISMRTEPVFLRAGPQRITAAFVRRTEGPVEDLLRPHDWSMSDRHTALGARGLQARGVTPVTLGTATGAGFGVGRQVPGTSAVGQHKPRCDRGLRC